MKIEFSVPKLIFGNNFDEVEEVNFEDIIKMLKIKLRQMGVLIFEKFLVNAPVSAIHYSKNILLTDYSTPYTYLSIISKSNINQRLDLNQTDFRNEGHSLKFRANSFEVAFYDKLKDLDKARTSEKRAEEKDNAIQLNLFETNLIKIRKPFEVLRMEVRLNKKYKIIQILKAIAVDSEPTFQALFKKDIAQKVLLHYIDEIERGYPSILNYKKGAKDFLADFIIKNSKASLKKAIQMLGLRTVINEIGIREFREITKLYGKTSWYRLNKELKEFYYPKGIDAFKTIKTAITEFIPLRLSVLNSGGIN
ncbi:MAG: hypothetical protein Q8P26_00600 [Candidatus Levybacteria bacterium]|nr:hypothetical protein [Candidatus Levybacteria bacterium]